MSVVQGALPKRFEAAAGTEGMIGRALLWACALAGALVAAQAFRSGLVVLTVKAVAGGAGALGLRATEGMAGTVLFSDASGSTFAYRVVEECTAVVVVGLYCVTLLVFPGVSWSRRLVGIVAGGTALLVLNWLRLLMLA